MVFIAFIQIRISTEYKWHQDKTMMRTANLFSQAYKTVT